MSHTSQRRGLTPSNSGEEIVVLAMIPKEYREKEDIKSAMKTLAEKMLSYNPHLWISHNFIELDIPQLGSKQSLLRILNRLRPQQTKKLLFEGVAEKSSVITEIYTDTEKVINLIGDLKKEWLENNRQNEYPISIVLSGLFDDIHRCCSRVGITEHTYLHSLGFRGRSDKLPDATHLELITMCGHGLISFNRIKQLVKRIQNDYISPRQAAEDIAKHCVCGIVNMNRAEKIFARLAQK